MKKKMFLFVALGTILLVSCGNSNNKVKDQAIENIVEEKLETKVISSPSSSMPETEKTTYTVTKITYKEWKFWNPKDEFGDVDKNVKVISLKLDAIRPNHEDEREHITIDYLLNKNKGVEGLIFSSSEMGRSYSEISFKMEDGSQYEFYGTDVGGNFDGAVSFTDKDDMKYIAEILDKGNFKLKVGNRVAKVTNETRGFRENVEKYFKGEDIEILLPRITRE